MRSTRITEPGSRPIIRRSAELAATPTRRAGLRERRLLTPAESVHQNILLIDAEPGATVELHPVQNSESFFVLQGRLEIFGDNFRHQLDPGDFCHFPPAMTHGVKILEGPARFLVTYAPAGGAGSA